MASSRRRKRVKQESDDDSGGPLATTSKSAAGAEASNDAAVGTAVKRRRLASTEPTGSFTSPSDAKSGTTTVTSTSDRRSRRKRPTKHSQRATSQLSESQANQELDSQDVKAIAVKSEGDDQGNDVHTDASTLSPVSDVDEQQDPSIRRMEDPDRKQEISQVKVEKESEDEQDSAPSRKFTRAEKGKGRATDGVETSKLQEEAALLRAELAKLKSELSESHLTSARHQSLVPKVGEALTCNICLEFLHHPLALTCGHVFCQDDLWNWFHREPDVDDESDSFDSFNSESDDDSSSEDSAGSDHRAVRHLLARRTSPSAATRAIGSSAQAGLRQSSRLNETTARQSQDLVTVEDDYNTDDPLDDSASDKSPSPVAVRGGFRIQTTRGEQVAAHRATLAANRAATQASAVASVPAVSELQTAANESASNGTRNADHRSQEPPTTGRTPRVPALARPRRKNLVCPQCRTPVSIPPFPIFALRGVSDLLAAQTTGRRAQSIEAEREGNSIVDETWGGLFSRGVRAFGRSALYSGSDHNRARNSRRHSGHPAFGHAERYELPDDGVELDPMLSDYNSDAEAPRSTTSSQDLAWLHQQVHRAEQLRTDDPLAIGGRVALEDLFSSEAPNTVPQNLPGQPHQDIANGLRRRHEAEHLQVNDRTRERNLNELLELRNARRRAHRAVARVHDTMNAGAQEEDRLREAEDRAIAAVRRELLLSRTARPRQHARLNRSRDVLRHGIRDAEDGVRRCVDCNWEIEDGICQHCGATYDSDSEFDANGHDLNETATSPSRPIREESQLSFVEGESDSERDLASYADDGEGAEDSDITDSTGEDLEDDPYENAETNNGSGNGARKSDVRRKRHQFMYDSEDDPEETEREEDEDNFFVDDGQVEHMDTSEVDKFLDDDDDEAEETDREERRARREERQQAKAARRLQAHHNSSDSFTDDTASEDESSDSEEDNHNQSTSLTSVATRNADSGQDEDEDGLPTISSQKVRRELQEQARQKKSSENARERAARAAMSRSVQQTAAAEDKASIDDGENHTAAAAAPARRKRVIQASDEE